MTTPRERIEHLLAMAQDDRTNKFEAEAALRQAAKLMRKHAIDAATIQARTGQRPAYNWRSVTLPANNPPAKTAISWVGMVAVAVARFTDCSAAWDRHDKFGMCIRFQGDEPDTIMAGYLFKHLRDSIRRQSAEFVGSRRERETFRRAMVCRLQERVHALKREQRQELTDTGSQALVVVNNKLQARDEHFGAFRTSSASPRRNERFAAEAGRRAGDRVGLNTPIPHQRAQLT